MAFQIRTSKDRKNQPDGIYITYQNVEWLIQGISITNSGNVALKLHDPIRLQNQIVTPCNIGDLQVLLDRKENGE